MKDAVKARLDWISKQVEESSAIVAAYESDNLYTMESDFINELNQTRVNNGPANRGEIPRIFNELNQRRENPMSEKKLEHLLKIFTTDKLLELWLRSRAEPALRGDRSDHNAMVGIAAMTACGDIDTLLNSAIKLEKASCSWAATVGPAVKALQRLGRTSAGYDFDALAEFARQYENII